MEVLNPVKHDDSRIPDECVDSIVAEDQDRVRRAFEDVEQIKICDGFYLVRTEESVNRVELSPEEYCECEDREYRDVTCKHLHAVKRMLPDIEEGDEFVWVESGIEMTVGDVESDMPGVEVEFESMLVDFHAEHRQDLERTVIAGEYAEYATKEYYYDELEPDMLRISRNGVYTEGDMTAADVPKPSEAPEWLLRVHPGRTWSIRPDDKRSGSTTHYAVIAVYLVREEAKVEYDDVGSFIGGKRTYDVDELTGRFDPDLEGYEEWYDEVVRPELEEQTDLTQF